LAQALASVNVLARIQRGRPVFIQLFRSVATAVALLIFAALTHAGDTASAHPDLAAWPTGPSQMQLDAYFAKQPTKTGYTCKIGGVLYVTPRPARISGNDCFQQWFPAVMEGVRSNCS
jgi:hypothetical protein